MKNILVFGSGRSGTSLMMALLSESGYHMESDMYVSRQSNPLGFYEGPEINNLNEQILHQVIPKRGKFSMRFLKSKRPGPGQLWLSKIGMDVKFPENKEIENSLKRVTSNTPFCYKDPRISYTYPVWVKFLKNTIKIINFRHPTSSIKSMIKEVNHLDYLRNLKFSWSDGMDVWQLMYQHVLRSYKEDESKEDWIFVHYEQVLDGSALDKIESKTGAKLKISIIDPALYRSKPDDALDAITQDIYLELCSIAEYKSKLGG